MSRIRPRRSLAIPFLSLSVLLHLVALLLAIVILWLNPEGCARPLPHWASRPMQISLVDESARPDITKLTQALEKEDKKKKEEDRKSKGQVVDLDRPREEIRPETARFRSEYDSTVARETKARQNMPARPGKKTLKKLRRRSPTQTEPSQRQRKPFSLSRRRKASSPRQNRRKVDVAADPRVRSALSNRDKRSEKLKSGQEDHLAKEGRPKVTLSQSQLNQIFGVRANDALLGVERGDETLLNSKRWRYASFFNRVKREVGQNWHPDRVYRRRDPTGNVYGYRDRFTVVRVSLTPAGKLRDLVVEKGSGVGFLDEEAMNAFRIAEPFPNPPRGLVDDATGLISFRFGFMFEISSGSSFRIFRYGATR